jgi:hypothetical protein
VKETFTNKIRHLAAGKLGIVLCSALLGYTTYGQPSVSVEVSVPLPSVQVVLPSVEIRAESDFYEPLTPYGRWEVVGAYGRCWIPGGVEADWRPYSEGYWQRTDAGWYWVSDEPWGWATYHYGRWNLSAQFGWYWVPQTQWAPAWVSWHSGGGYVGWAPLYPSDVIVISPRAYVFVEERHFMDPVRRSTVVVNNTTIINKTVINEAPATAAIEKASGRKVQAVAVQELRHKAEAPVVARQRTPVSAGEKTVQPPVRSEAQPAEKKAVAAHEPPQVEKPAAATHESAAPAPKNNEAQAEKHKPVPAAPEFKPEAKPEGNNHPPAIKEPTGQNANKQPVKQEKSAQPSDQKEQRVSEQPAMEKPAASEKNGPNPADKNHEDKVKE